MKNKDLKKVYAGIFRKGYEKTYTSVYTKKVICGDELTEEIKEVLKEGPWKNKKVIDVGCGTGLFDSAAAKRGARVLGVDYIPKAIETASQTHKHHNLSYKVGTALGIKGTYDIIVSIGTLEHMDDPFEVLQNFKRHLNRRGKIIITSPNWTNPRGYMLQTLFRLFNAPITLADLHYFTPKTFEVWAKKLKMEISWRTFDNSWAYGPKLVKDFKKRIPNVLRDANLPKDQRRINDFIRWIEQDVISFDHKSKFSGALGIYVFS
jgi:2-polyprenyl-3-methyl-5-hydroxy-6-metoxy-1,4-benzoquinol methylase